MATEPDDIVVEAGEPADSRSVEQVGGHRSQFEAKPSIAQARKKGKGECRLVIELPFDFSEEFLRLASKDRGYKYNDGAEYLRTIADQYENGRLDVQDLIDLSAHHSSNGIRVSVSK